VSNTYLVDLCVKLSDLLPQEWLVELSEHTTCWGKVTPIRVSGSKTNPETGRNLICLIYFEAGILIIHCADINSAEVQLARLRIKESMEEKRIQKLMLSYLECSINCESCRKAAPFYEGV
jgi:hypothetical protein